MTNLQDEMIKCNNKLDHTKPEKMFNAYQESRGMDLVWNIKLPFRDGTNPIEFQIDFLHKDVSGTPDIDFEIDGNHWHSSPRELAKDNWKDNIKNMGGLKVIHIPEALCNKRYWDYLDEVLPGAMLSPIGSIRIYA